MRSRIINDSVKYLEYEIRKIVVDAKKIQSLGVDVIWENIGDPVAVGEKMAPWIKDIVTNLTTQDKSYAYCPSQGIDSAREFLAEQSNKLGGPQSSADDIIFVNGIADAIDKIYDLIHRDARVIMPTPCYPTHGINEIKRGEYPALFYRMNPRNDWQPDIEDLRSKVENNPQIVAMTLICPDNPTGMVHTRQTLIDMVRIAKDNDLFIICDQIYGNVIFNGAQSVFIEEVIGDVPAIVLRGISKEYPWPGSRCGWLHVLNRGKDKDFDKYVEALVKTKMMEVCSTTLPQMSIPLVMGDERYPAHLEARAKKFELRANEAYDTFKDIDGVIVNRPQGAFYFPVVFENGLLNDKQTLPINNVKAKELVEAKVGDFPVDKRFVYYLLASKGVCVSPLSGFHSDLLGFRMTLLQENDEIRRESLQRVASAIREYIGS